MKKLQFLVLVLVASAFAYPAKDLKLEYAFKIGDQYTLTQVIHQNIKQTIPGAGEMNFEVDVNLTVSLKVAERTATGAKFELQLQKMKTHTKVPMGMGDVGMDSESTDDNPRSKAAKAMMNKTFYMTLSKLGVVESVEGIDNLFTDFGNLGLDDVTLTTTKQQLQTLMSAENQKANFSSAFIVYPVKKVKVLATWTALSDGLAMSFPTKIDNTMTLKSAEVSKASIAVDGTIASADKDKVVNMLNGMKGKLNVTGRQALIGSVNPKTGWPTEIKGVIETKGTMTLLAGGMIPQDMEIPVEIVDERQFTLIRK